MLVPLCKLHTGTEYHLLELEEVLSKFGILLHLKSFDQTHTIFSREYLKIFQTLSVNFPCRKKTKESSVPLGS